jgi:hypothetical protein
VGIAVIATAGILTVLTTPQQQGVQTTTVGGDSGSNSTLISTSMTTSSTGLPSETSSATIQPSVTSVYCSPNTAPVGSTSLCTSMTRGSATNAMTPRGVVMFETSGNGSFSLPACSQSGQYLLCFTSFSIGLNSEGISTISANYTGDGTFAPSSNSSVVTITRASAILSVSCSPGSIPLGGWTDCIASVSGNASVPSGVVTFSYYSASGRLASSCSLQAGSCVSQIVPSGPIGMPSAINASYPGDSNHAGSNSSTSVIEMKRATSIDLQCSPSAVMANAQVSCSAEVVDTSPGVATIPSGTVTPSSNSTGSFSPTSCTLVNGSCSFDFNPKGNSGTTAIGAAYFGDPTHNSSSLLAAQDFLVHVVSRSTAVALQCTLSTVVVGEGTVCTATVSDTSSGGTAIPSGNVSFSSDPLGELSHQSCILFQGSCSVTFTPTRGTEGVLVLNATYGGDPVHAGSSGFAQIQADARSVSVRISCSPSSVANSSSSSCTVTVADVSPGDVGTPTGTVSLSDNASGTFPASCSLQSGSCSFTYIAPATAGIHDQIVALYDGAKDYTRTSDASILTIT